MKVLFWMSISFDRRTPSEHLLTAMVEALYEQGHTVHIIQKNTNGPLPKLPAPLEALGVTTQCIPCTPPQKSNLIARYLADIKYVFACRKHVRKKDDYGAVFMQSTNVAGFVMHMLKHRLPGVPVTYNVQDIFPDNAGFSGSLKKGSLPYKVLAKIQKYAYKKADHVITISEDMRDQLIADGVSAEKTEVIYNWSYRDTPYRAEEMDCTVARSLFPAEKFNVVYAGNIGVMQNVDILLQTAASMKEEENVVFHILGDGAYKEKLQQFAQQMELSNVLFHPMQSSELAPSLYVTADVNVIPLVKEIYRTALPSKTATCLACGKPVIFCIGKEAKFAQLAEKEAGCVCLDSDDPLALKEAILKLRDKQTGNLDAFFTSKFKRSVNSMRYATIISMQ